MMSAKSWRVAAASVEGTSHTKQGLPCQDAMVARFLADRNGEDVLVIVVSDGAGSAAKAEIGSALTCSVVAEAVEVFLAEGCLVTDISNELTLEWLSLLRTAIRDQADQDGAAMSDYACTLLFAVVGADAIAVAQLGDGATVVSDADGWAWVHWPQHGDYANTTYFVTTDDAASRIEFSLSRTRIDDLAVFTDGLEGLVLHHASKTVFSPFFDRMMPAVRRSTVDGMDAELSAALSQYLSSSVVCDRTDDDKTLVLASRLSSDESTSTIRPASD